MPDKKLQGLPERIRTAVVREREAWIRFLLAVCGLALAFTAAVFSTVERIAGNLIATAVLASLSLIIAAVVGLATVPFLARRVVVRRVREAFDYKVTREGWVYLVFTLVIGIAALNTGNNLLFLMVAAMLAAVVVSGIVSAAMLRGLQLDVSIPDHSFAGAETRLVVRLCNRRKWLPAFSVSVLCPQDPSRAKRAVLDRAIYFPYVPARSCIDSAVQITFSSRGRYSQQTFGVSSRFPFSFLLKTRRVQLSRELVVFPAVGTTEDILQLLPLIRGEFASFVSGRGYDLYRIRDYGPGDSARHIDWKASAKTADVKVREFTREDERRLRIIFDNPEPGMLNEAEYERAVSIAASLAWNFYTDSMQLSCFVPGHSAGSDVFEFLTYLALVEPSSEQPVLDDLNGPEEFNLIVTARPRGTIATELWSRSYFVFVP